LRPRNSSRRNINPDQSVKHQRGEPVLATVIHGSSEMLITSAFPSCLITHPPSSTLSLLYPGSPVIHLQCKSSPILNPKSTINRVLFGRSRTVSYPTLPTLRTTRFTRSYPLSFTTDPIYTKSKWSTSSPPLSPRSSRCALQLRLSLPTRLARRLLSSVSVRKSTFPS